MSKLQKYTQSEIERLALKGLEYEEQQKKYSLWHISKELNSFVYPPNDFVKYKQGKEQLLRV